MRGFYLKKAVVCYFSELHRRSDCSGGGSEVKRDPFPFSLCIRHLKRDVFAIIDFLRIETDPTDDRLMIADGDGVAVRESSLYLSGGHKRISGPESGNFEGK